MARPRIRQFAGDLNIEYDEAKNLVSEGRRRKDGGSQILENNMSKMTEKKVAKVSKGLKKASKLHAGQAKTLDSLEFQVGGTLRSALEKLNKQKDDTDKMADIVTKDTEIGTKDEKVREVKKRGRKRMKKAMGGSADVGTSSQARGAGAAIRGTKFSGVF